MNGKAEQDVTVNEIVHVSSWAQGNCVNQFGMSYSNFACAWVAAGAGLGVS